MFPLASAPAPAPAPDARPALLIVDDETLFAKAAARHLDKRGHPCRVAGSLQAAREALASGPPPALILLDMRLPDGHGFELLAASAEGEPEQRPVFIMLTAYGELEDAVQAMKLGAADYVKKPVDLDELALTVDKALAAAQLRRRVDLSREREVHAVDEPLMLGQSAALAASRQQLESLGQLRVRPDAVPPTVLLLGETGTGKDVAARVLHRSGPWRGRPFVQIDCASLPRELIEAELFGAEKGAYTGAQARRVGLIEAAEDGTVFLDELGELGLELQAKLLNVLERRVVRRVGGVREFPVAARFVAGTNRDLAAMVAAGQFRADLYYRLNVIHVTLPPLRERGDDVLLLARHFAEQTARRYGLDDPRWAADALPALRAYRWPGNVRELKHLIERAVLLNAGRPLGAAELGLPEARPRPALHPAALPPAWATVAPPGAAAPPAPPGAAAGGVLPAWPPAAVPASWARAAAPAAWPAEAAPGPALAPHPAAPPAGGPAEPEAGDPLAALDGLSLEEVERRVIDRALARSRGNVSEAARQLGITRMALRYRLDKMREATGGLAED